MISSSSVLKPFPGKGAIHRDLKSDNCFVDGAMRCKVGDFGAGKSALASHMQVCECNGTTQYVIHYTANANPFVNPHECRGPNEIISP